ncbi:hypothetical protein EV360DRAFT_80141 [Lentinula raphanica]|nr:hypothetical protein EV360DRAFT_80141 [Lentinula raphanica]
MAQRIRSWTIVFSDAYVKRLGRTKHQKIYTCQLPPAGSTEIQKPHRFGTALQFQVQTQLFSFTLVRINAGSCGFSYVIPRQLIRWNLVCLLSPQLTKSYHTPTPTHLSSTSKKSFATCVLSSIHRLLEQIIHYLFLQLPFNMKIPSLLLYSPHMLYVLMLLQVVLDLGSIASPVPQPLSLHEGPVVQDAPSPKRRSELSSYTGWTHETKPETAIKKSPIDHTVKLFVLGGNGVAFQIGEDMMSFRQAVRYVRNGAVASGFSVSQSSRPDGSGGTTVGSVHVSYIERESFWSAIQERAPYDTELHLTQVVFEKLGGMKFTQTKAQLAARKALLERIRNLPNAK